MGFISKIQQTAGKFFLKREISHSKRHRAVVDYSRAKNIGILFVLDEEKDYSVIREYVKHLQDHQKHVKAIGFIKNQGLHRNLLQVLSFDFINEKDLNWYGMPHTEKSKNFIAKEFDVCIDLSDHKTLPLLYLAAFSNAHYKVGIYDKQYLPVYDLMIETTAAMETRELIENIDKYLSVLIPKSHA